MVTPITLSSPLPPADLWFDGMTLTQGLSELEEMQLTLLSDKPDLSPEDLLGQPLTVKVALREQGQRHFNGLVSRFVAGDVQGRHYSYAATVRPWLWFLTRTSDCRIFQDQTVPDIVKSVFQDHEAIAKAEYKLFRSYRQRTYCVQYRESDYHFVARLLEEEGIYWYFRHDEGVHTLVLVDDAAAHEADPACAELPYYANGEQVPPDIDYCARWRFTRQVKPGQVALTSYDFERPSTKLSARKTQARSHSLAEYEQFDWRGEWVQQADGQQLAENRLDEWQAAHEQASGGTNAQSLAVGALFDLARHPREDRNGSYLCTRTRISATVEGSESDDRPGRWHCEFQAMPSTQQYRPRRVTPKPFMQGPQTAVVTGPSGEEIFTDRHGRVKVQFHWDRRGQCNENSSCWIRVSQPWAGKGWGSVSIPRIGQEVVVDFLEGDPDQPLITGRVYNAEQTPPFDLPAGAVVSGIKSKSHKAVGYNEVSMDDTAGKEKVTIHGQYDMATTVEHDQTTTVHNNRTDTIDVDDTESVGNDQKQSVGHDHTQSVGHDHKQTVTNDQTISVGQKQSITVGADRIKHVVGTEKVNVDVDQHVVVGGDRTRSVSGAETVDVSRTQTVTVKLMKTEKIGLVYALNVGAAMNQAVGAALMQEVAGAKIVGVGGLSSENVAFAKSINAGTNMTLDAKAKLALKSGAAFSGESGATMSFKSSGDWSANSQAKAALEAASELVLKCGSAELILKSSGEISLKGSSLSINGSDKIVIKASGDVDVKGSNVNVNS